MENDNAEAWKEIKDLTKSIELAEGYLQHLQQKKERIRREKVGLNQKREKIWTHKKIVFAGAFLAAFRKDTFSEGFEVRDFLCGLDDKDVIKFAEKLYSYYGEYAFLGKCETVFKEIMQDDNVN